MKIYNPATEELITELTEDNKSLLQKKYNILKQGQLIWAKKPIQERINIIEHFVKLLEENTDALIADLHQETGKLLMEARNEINGACYRVKFFLDHAGSTLQDKI